MLEVGRGLSFFPCRDPQSSGHISVLRGQIVKTLCCKIYLKKRIIFLNSHYLRCRSLFCLLSLNVTWRTTEHWAILQRVIYIFRWKDLKDLLAGSTTSHQLPGRLVAPAWHEQHRRPYAVLCQGRNKPNASNYLMLSEQAHSWASQKQSVALSFSYLCWCKTVRFLASSTPVLLSSSPDCCSSLCSNRM